MSYPRGADADTETRADLVFSFSPYEQHAIERARPVEMAEAKMQFAAPEDVVIHKLVAGRPRDHEDVKSILSESRELDEAYLRRWLNEFSATLDQPLTDQFENLRAQAYLPPPRTPAPRCLLPSPTAARSSS